MKPNRFVLLKGFIIFVLGFLFVTQAQGQSLSIIVHKDNPVLVISDKDLAAYFLKNKRVWPHGLKVNPIFYLDDWPLSQKLRERLLQMNERQLEQHWSKQIQRKGIYPPLKLRTTEEMVGVVGYDVSALGFLLTDEVNEDLLKKVRVVRTLEIN